MKPMTDNFDSWIMEGYFRVTNDGRVVVDKKNAIMNTATTITARGLAGLANSSISHLYLAYSNNDNVPANPYTITPSATSFTIDANRGLLRIPLTFPATITEAQDGSYSMVNFNILVNQPGTFKVGASHSITNADKFFEAGLVCQTDPNGSPSNIGGDLVLARVAFERLTYDANFNLTISWGIKLNNA